MTEHDCSINVSESLSGPNAQSTDSQRIIAEDASHTAYSTHDGFTTIVSDNDLVQRDVQPPLDITTTSDIEVEEAIHRKWNWERIRFLTFYFVTVTILFSDVNLMAPNLTM